LAIVVLTSSARLSAEETARVLIVVGPSNHAPGTHEVQAGARLIEHCLEHAQNVDAIEVDVHYEWPADADELEGVSTIVFSGDRFPPMEMDNSEKIMADVSRLMDSGCGIVCFHYATGLNASHVAEDGAHPLLGWMGGYFATRCPHHQSIAKVWTAHIEPGDTPHPVLSGWQPFTLTDEPYINNYFGKEGMAENVTPIATTLLPPDAPKRECIGWAVSREDGGRGVGIVMPHFYKNWRVDDLRMLVMNSIVWTAHRNVPADGVQTPRPDLAQFDPAAIEQQPRVRKPK
jgi:type 1 glutamine amidotransferase